MAFQYVDRVRVSTTTVGTGTLSLGSAIAGFRTFASAVTTGALTSGATVPYVIEDTANTWEVGWGVYTNGVETLTRSVTSNSSGNTTPLSLSGSAQVYITASSAALVTSSIIGGSINNTPIGATTPSSINASSISNTGGALETQVALTANNINLSLGTFFTKTITVSTTLTISNVPVSSTVAAFILELTNGGAYTITWWGTIKWASATAPTLSTSGLDVLGFYTIDGSTWRGFVLGKAMA